MGDFYYILKIGCLLARGCIKLNWVNYYRGMGKTAIVRIKFAMRVASFYMYTIGIGVWWMAEERMLLVFVVDGGFALLCRSLIAKLSCCVLFFTTMQVEGRRCVSELICLSRLATESLAWII